MIRRMRTLGLWLGAAALLPAAALAQRPGERQILMAQPLVSFPSALTLAVGISSFGARAERAETLFAQDSSPHNYTYSLVKGLTGVARLQSPLGRRFGLMLGASVAYRAHDTKRDGEPFTASDDKVLSLRGEAGLLFRFKPAAPVYFGASVVYQRHNPAPVEGQTASNTTESGGGIGIGYEFERRGGTSARLEMWNYWMSPSSSGILAPIRPSGSAHDFVLTLGVTRRITPVRRRG